jgi:hypothetical protein
LNHHHDEDDIHDCERIKKAPNKYMYLDVHCMNSASCVVFSNYAAYVMLSSTEAICVAMVRYFQKSKCDCRLLNATEENALSYYHQPPPASRSLYQLLADGYLNQPKRRALSNTSDLPLAILPL